MCKVMCSSEACVPVCVGNLSEDTVQVLMLTGLSKESTSLLTFKAVVNLGRTLT